VIKHLCGDKSDALFRSVKGIGKKKTAVTLLNEYDTLGKFMHPL
jgi:5'-3' exonuclease